MKLTVFMLMISILTIMTMMMILMMIQIRMLEMILMMRFIPILQEFPYKIAKASFKRVPGLGTSTGPRVGGMGWGRGGGEGCVCILIPHPPGWGC